MATLKEYNVKLARLRSTRKMTKTMKMVSANKLRKAQEAERRAGEYRERFQEVVRNLGMPDVALAHPLMAAREPKAGRAALVLITSDKGLCGAFNADVLRKAHEWMGDEDREGRAVEIALWGRRGKLLWRGGEGREIWKVCGDSGRHHTFADTLRISTELQAEFLSGRVDEAYVAYNKARGTASREAVVERLLPLPLELQADDADPVDPAAWLTEPSREQWADIVVPRLVHLKLHFMFLDSAAGEHGARMMAMDNATRNADGLIERYTLLRNRARQSEITTELIEIVAGAEALKG